MMLHDDVYAELLKLGGPIIGALAYSAYKQHKREWVTQYMADNEGALPDAAAREAFRRAVLLESALQGYHQRGKALGKQFLASGLERKLEKIRWKVKQSELANSITQSVASLFYARKSLSNWLKDAGTSILTNMLALVLAGALVLGWKSLDEISAAVTVWAKTDGKHSAPAKPSLPGRQ
jgi:hypothetical protein